MLQFLYYIEGFYLNPKKTELKRLFFIEKKFMEKRMRLKNTLVAALLAAGTIAGTASISQADVFAATTETKTTTKASTQSATKATSQTATKASKQTETKTSGSSSTKTSGSATTKTSGTATTKTSGSAASKTPSNAASKTSEAKKDKTVKIKIEGKDVEVPATGYKWVVSNGYFHFVKDGKLVTGWKKLTQDDGEKTEHWSYFDKTNGRIYTGWRSMGTKEGETVGHWSYFGDNGWLRTGWQQMGKGTANPDGNSEKHWSYFGANGWLRTGWQQMGKGTANPDGNAEKHWSYFGGNGWMVKGWYKDSKGLHYFGSNGWMYQSGTKKIDRSDYTFNANGILTGVNHSDFKYVNQYRTYGYYPMSCGSSSSLMAMQAAGYCKNIDTKAEYEDYLSSWRAVCGSSFGKKGGVGACYPSKIVNAIKSENTTRGVPVKGVTGGAVSAEYLKDSLTHGQTSVVIVQNFKVYTHWIAITGWEMKGNELVFKTADPLPNDCGRGAASSATKVTQGNLGTSMKKSTLFGLVDAKIVRMYHGGRSCTTFGNYKALNSYY